MKTFSMGVLVLLFICFPLHATTYYIANAGNDASAGTSASKPWRTIARLNTALLSAGPGDSFLLRGGDVFRDDYIRCGVAYSNPGKATVSSNPPKCAGRSGDGIVIGAYGTGSPILDAADPISGLKWTRVTGNTWSAPLPRDYEVPVKLYFNSATKEALPLIPVPNCRGSYAAGTVHKFLDCVEVSGKWFTYGVPPSQMAAPSGYSGSYFPQVQANQQWFPANRSALQIVEEGASSVAANPGFGYPTQYPGLWYTDGDTIWVNLTSGSNPNTGQFEGTHRPYGVVLEGVNYVTVTGLTVEHTALSGIVSFPHATARNTYFVGEYNSIEKNTVYNWGSLVSADNTLQQSHNLGDVGGIVVRNDSAGHLVRGNLIQHNFVGLNDGWFDLVGPNDAGIIVDGIDGGGSANLPTVIDNYVRTVTTQGVNWENNTNGGLQAYNELTNNQGNDYFHNSRGGQLDHEFIHESYAEGIQIGGNIANNASLPQLISFNTIANIGLGANNGLFDGIDCNGNAVNAGIRIYNNTIVNTWAAGATFEGTSKSAASGCQAIHFYNNLIDQDFNSFPGMTAVNNSYDIYFGTAQAHVRGMDFHNNIYLRSNTQRTLAQGNASKYASCTDFFSGWPDLNSSCPAEIGFVNPLTDDFRLSASSSARGTGERGTDIGAMTYGATQLQSASKVRGAQATTSDVF